LQTIIFDSCHSGSGTRTSDPSRLARVSKLENNVPSDLDRDIWGNELEDMQKQKEETEGARSSVVPSFSALAGLRSHVLLAACRAEEQAWEENKRGVFTKAFLQTLRSVELDKLTYKDVLFRMPEIPSYVSYFPTYLTLTVLVKILSVKVSIRTGFCLALVFQVPVTFLTRSLYGMAQLSWKRELLSTLLRKPSLVYIRNEISHMDLMFLGRLWQVQWKSFIQSSSLLIQTIPYQMVHTLLSRSKPGEEKICAFMGRTHSYLVSLNICNSRI
jgi:hypothetical protein